MVTLLFVFATIVLAINGASMPLPWTRELYVTSPVMKGNDVLIATTLMARCSAWPSSVAPSSSYTTTISNAVKKFQSYGSLSDDGIFGPSTADLTLSDYSYDKYVDDAVRGIDYGVLYKIYIPVYNDSARNIETMGQLFDENNTLLLTFDTRTHGQSNPPNPNWPNYDNKPGLNEFSGDGNTPTGLSYIDLNSPEPANDVKYYGPYPIHRVISGIKYKNITSNADMLLQPDSTNMRSGILMHTGEWPNWQDGDQMPDSDGCIHVYPDVLNNINTILTTKLGVVVHQNPYSSKNYPYTPQGIISVQQI